MLFYKVFLFLFAFRTNKSTIIKAIKKISVIVKVTKYADFQPKLSKTVPIKVGVTPAETDAAAFEMALYAPELSCFLILKVIMLNPTALTPFAKTTNISVNASVKIKLAL